MQIHVLRSEINVGCFLQSCSMFYLIFLEESLTGPKAYQFCWLASQKDHPVSTSPHRCCSPSPVSSCSISSLTIYTMHFHINLPLNSSKIHSLFITHLTLCHLKKKSTESNLCCPYTLECTGVWLTCKKDHTKKTEFPSPRSYQFAESSSIRGSSSSPSSLCVLWLQFLSQALQVRVKSRKHCHAPSLALSILLSPLLQ